MARRVNPVGRPTEPSYPKQKSRSRRDFLELLALGSLGVLGLPSQALADEPDESLLLETMDLGEGYTFEFFRSPGEDARKALGEVRPWLVDYVARHVTPDGMHDSVKLDGYNAALTAVLAEALSPAVVQDVSLGHDCFLLCPGRRQKTRGMRAEPDPDFY